MAWKRTPPSAPRMRSLYLTDFFARLPALCRGRASAEVVPVTNPITPTDSVFLKHFAMLIGFLVIVALVLMALAAHIYGDHPPPQNPDTHTPREHSLRSVGPAASRGTGPAALHARG